MMTDLKYSLGPSKEKWTKPAQYSEQDFYVTWGRDISNSNRSLLYIFDTLTLTCNASTGELYSFDVYTNRQLWKKSSISGRQTEKEGSLYLEIKGPEDRYGFPISPEFIYEPHLKELEIRFSNETASKYLKVGSYLLAGTCDDKIVSLVCLSIEFTP